MDIHDEKKTELNESSSETAKHLPQDVGGIEVAVRVLRLSRSRIYQLSSKDLIPVHRIPEGSKLYFSESELVNHILTNGAKFLSKKFAKDKKDYDRKK